MTQTLINWRREIMDFFRTGTKNSMNRFGVFLGFIAAFIVSLAAIWLTFHDKLTLELVSLVAVLWAAAHGGKTWAKSVELKHKENETIKESDS